jgi:trehalose 6-phosphate phosphatase
MKRKPWKAVILDMDGVITQTARLHARAWKSMFDEYLQQRSRWGDDVQEPFDIQRDYHRYVDGKSRNDGVRSFLASRGIQIPDGDQNEGPNESTVSGLGHRKNSVFHDLLQEEGVEVYEDTIEQIQKWKHAGRKIAVISSSRNCEAVLQAVGLLETFDAKVDGNDVAELGLSGKPSPDIFLRAAQQLGVEPGEAIVIEDAIAGVEAGRRGEFGMVVGVARGREAVPYRQAGADRVVGDLRELDVADDDVPNDGPHKTPASALEQAAEIAARLDAKQLALFLDYDGTLTPIVRRAEDAILSEAMRSLLASLAKHCTVAIVSGRDRRDAERMVQLEHLVYAGSHGFDIRGPDGLAMQHQEAHRLLPELDAAEETLRSQIASIEGVRVERKKYAIAVHYRDVSSDQEIGQVELAVDAVLVEHAGLRKRGGKKIFELQPDVPWDKGHAVSWLTEALELDHAGVLVMYLGDDVTDEDAFRVLAKKENGIGIRVGDAEADTQASYRLADCGEVEEFLQSLLRMLQTKKGES